MADFKHVQLYGVPVIAYGMIALTTGVLAYATAVSGLGGSSTSMTDVVGPPTSILGTSPEAPVAQEPSSAPEGITSGGKKHKRKTPKSKGKRSKHNKSTKSSKA